MNQIIEKELTKIAQNFLKNNYGIDLNIPIKRNNRLRSTHGRFMINANQKPLRIEIAGKAIDYGTDEAIIGILKHECIHYALYLQGRAYQDGHPEFEGELRKHQAPSTNTFKIGIYYVFSCNRCGKTYESIRKQLAKTPSKYKTKCCQASLTVIGERVYNGEICSLI